MPNPRITEERVVRSLRGVVENNWRSVSTTFTFQASDVVLICDTSGGGFTVTLPPAEQMIGRLIYICKGAGGNTLTISSADNINGAGTLAAATAYWFVVLFSDGTTWYAKG